MQKYQVNKHFLSDGKSYVPGMIVRLDSDFAKYVQKRIGKNSLTLIQPRKKAEVEIEPKGTVKAEPTTKSK